MPKQCYMMPNVRSLIDASNIQMLDAELIRAVLSQVARSMAGAGAQERAAAAVRQREVHVVGLQPRLPGCFLGFNVNLVLLKPLILKYARCPGRNNKALEIKYASRGMVPGNSCLKKIFK